MGGWVRDSWLAAKSDTTFLDDTCNARIRQLATSAPIMNENIDALLQIFLLRALLLGSRPMAGFPSVAAFVLDEAVQLAPAQVCWRSFWLWIGPPLGRAERVAKESPLSEGSGTSAGMTLNRHTERAMACNHEPSLRGELLLLPSFFPSSFPRPCALALDGTRFWRMDWFSCLDLVYRISVLLYDPQDENVIPFHPQSKLKHFYAKKQSILVFSNGHLPLLERMRHAFAEQ